MKTQKIKKHKNPFEFWEVLTRREKTIVMVPVVLALVATVALAVVAVRLHRSGGASPQTPMAMREVLMQTDGKWDDFSDYGINVWIPNELPQETLGEGKDKYMKLSAQRDKGNYPELVLGTFLVPDEQQGEYNLQADQSQLLDVIRPYMSDALATMFNGVNPVVTVDVEVVQLTTGEYAMQGKGEAACTVVFRDPKDPENPYSEEVTINLYYLCKIFHGRPVVAWGAWDYSTYEGEARTIAAVKDAITSVMRADDATIVEPQADDWNTVAPHYGAPAEDYSTNTWDEDKQAWVDDQTGEVDTTLPPPEDEYWDDKRVDPDTDADGETNVTVDPTIPVDDVSQYD